MSLVCILGMVTKRPLTCFRPFALCQQGDITCISGTRALGCLRIGWVWPDPALLTKLLGPVSGIYRIQSLFPCNFIDITNKEVKLFIYNCMYYTWKFFWIQIRFKAVFGNLFEGTCHSLSYLFSEHTHVCSCCGLIIASGPHQMPVPPHLPIIESLD